MNEKAPFQTLETLDHLGQWNKQKNKNQSIWILEGKHLLNY